MGYILDNCPTQHQCCWSVPLRPAVLTIAMGGLLWACLYFSGFTAAGASAAKDLGLPEGMARVLRYVHGVFGILLFAVNVVLLAAAACESDSLCEVYLWFMVVFGAVLAASSLAVATAAALSGELSLAGAYLVAVLLVALMFVYFAVVVGNYRMTLP